MQFKLTLQPAKSPSQLPFSYQYPISAAIYKIIQRADAQFAAFLHDTGYGKGHKNFKMFTFSDLQTACRPNGDRMEIPGQPVGLTVCFHITEAAENFIKGLFMHQQLEVADSRSRATFTVQQVEALPNGLPNGGSSPGRVQQVVLQALSPLVVGRKNNRGHYDYRAPLDADFAACLLHNWVEKYAALYPIKPFEEEMLRSHLQVKVLPGSRPPKQRLITIKQGTPYETKVRGYSGFRMQVQAPAALLELALNAGLGLHNAQGMGCVGVVGESFMCCP